MRNGHEPTLSEEHSRMRTEGAYEREEETRTLEDYECDVTESLGRFYNRSGFQAAEHKTPLDDLLGRSDEFDEMTDDQLAGWLHRFGVDVELARGDMISVCHALLSVRLETIRRFGHFCSQDGLAPYDIMRNVFAAFGQMELEPWIRLTVREKGLILGESHGASHFRIHAMCVNLLRRKGLRGFKTRAQKSSSAAARAAVAQRGNSNRKRQPRSRHRRTKKHQEKMKK